MTTSGLPFDDMRDLAARLPPVDRGAGQRMRVLLDGLGRLEELAGWLAAATARRPPRVVRPVVALYAATHGVSRRLGSDDPVGEVRALVEAIAAGAAPVSHLCASSDFGLNVFDLALDLPVGDVTREPALDERGCAATMAFGMEALAGGADLLCLGAVGRAGDVSAMALTSALAGGDGAEWEAGSETTALLAAALHRHGDHARDPLEAMRRLGGREIAAIAGAILAARTQKAAVVIDGLAATAAAAVLHALNPNALEHCVLAGAESPPHRRAAERIGLSPLLDLGTREGGVAGALAVGMIKAAGAVAAGLEEVGARAG